MASILLSIPALGAPLIKSISPASAYPGETVKVTFSGSGLSGTTGITGWGSCVPVSNLVATNTTVTATFSFTTCAAVGTHSLTLVTSGGKTNPVSFQVLPPVVTSISPATGIPGSSVNLTFNGHGLSGTTAVSGWGPCVTVNNLAATDTTVKVTFNIETCAAAGSHSLTLVTPSGNTNAVSFQIVPSITGVTPASAYPGETVRVTFSGGGLSGATGISGWGPCAAVSNLTATNTAVTATFAFLTCAAVGTHNLSLVTSSGNTNSAPFQVLAPAVTSISPSTAVPGSTVNVTFSGHGLSGTTAVSGWGPCATVSSLAATDTSVKATFNVGTCAYGGSHALTIETPAGNTNTVSFQVLAPTLSLSESAIPFGDQAVNTTASQTLTLTSTGTAPVTVSSASIAGTGFSMSGATFPVTLNPGVAITLQVQFDPPATATDTGSITFLSNSSTGSILKVALSGTGARYVKLTWQAPTKSSDPVAGYKVYRALSGTNLFQELNSSAVIQTAYSDQTVESGSSYTYYVVSVDSEGAASGPSNQFTIAVP